MEAGKSSYIVPLTDNNYPTWKVQVKMNLMREGLYSIVSGVEQVPTNDSDLRKYSQRRDKALATIVLAIDVSLLYLVGDPQDPAEVWKLLEDTFYE